MDDVERLLAKLGQHVVVLEVENWVCWNLSKDGVFSVRSMYQVLQF